MKLNQNGEKCSGFIIWECEYIFQKWHFLLSANGHSLQLTRAWVTLNTSKLIYEKNKYIKGNVQYVLKEIS